MKHSILVIVCLLAGCSTIAGQAPSVKACQHVTYEREYSHVKITADCDVMHNGISGGLLGTAIGNIQP